MILFSLKLFIAHLLGDFAFQPDKWVKHKRVHKVTSKYFYLHIGIHFLCLFAILSFQQKYIITIAAICISHYLIDLAKLYLEKHINERLLFFMDQMAHLLVLALAVYFWHPFELEISLFGEAGSLLLIACGLGVTIVSATIMKLIMAKWSLDEDSNDQSLPKAGYYIGLLERSFVFIFIILQQWQAIGFLIAAKSVFRFGDLSKARDRKLTEYILIGTLLSFGLAILIGLLYLQLRSLV